MTSNSDDSIRQPLRVGVWCAVSSKPQAADDKISLEDQERAGRRFAQSIGGQVVAVYIVPGHSRDIIFYPDAEKQMDAYRQLHEDIKAGRLDVLHTIDPDRLGRDPALAQQILSLVEKNGAEVYCASNPHIIGQKGTGSRYAFAIQATRAGEEQLRRVEYHARGLRNRVGRGLPPYQWPLGYTPIYNERGQVIGAQLNEYAEVIRLITTQFLAGASYSDIVRMLNGSTYRSPFAPTWGISLVRRAMHNDVYAGYTHWRDARNEQPSDRYPPIWDTEIYQAILRERQRRSRLWQRRPRHISPFLNIIWCAKCGKRMIVNRNHNTPMLRCSTHATRARTGVKCHSNCVSIAAIVDALKTYFAGFTDPAALDAELNGVPATDHLNSQSDALHARLDQIKQKRHRLALAMASGAMSMDIYCSADNELVADQSVLEADLAVLKAEIASVPNPEQVRQAFSSARELLDHFFAASPEEINQVLLQTGVRVECEKNRIVSIKRG